MYTSGAVPGEIWRQLALEHVPACSAIIAMASHHSNLWQRFMELLATAGTDAARMADAEAIFNYAWWCVAESGNQRLAGEVEAYFYEDVAEYSNLNVFVPLYIAPWQFERLEEPFRYLLTDAEFDAFRRNYYAEAPGAYIGQAWDPPRTASQRGEQGDRGPIPPEQRGHGQIPPD